MSIASRKSWLLSTMRSTTTKNLRSLPRKRVLHWRHRPMEACLSSRRRPTSLSRPTRCPGSRLLNSTRTRRRVLHCCVACPSSLTCLTRGCRLWSKTARCATFRKASQSSPKAPGPQVALPRLSQTSTSPYPHHRQQRSLPPVSRRLPTEHRTGHSTGGFPHLPLATASSRGSSTPYALTCHPVAHLLSDTLRT